MGLGLDVRLPVAGLNLGLSLQALLPQDQPEQQETGSQAKTAAGNYLGVSENSVPLNPMVNDHYPYEMAIIGNIPYFQTNPFQTFWD